MQNPAGACLIFLRKGFVVRRLQISFRYALSSLLVLRKNLRRNHFARFCIETAQQPAQLERNVGESPIGRIGWFTTDSPVPVPPRGEEGKAVRELNRWAAVKANHIE
jgi:hypothetical protein